MDLSEPQFSVRNPLPYATLTPDSSTPAPPPPPNNSRLLVFFTRKIHVFPAFHCPVALPSPPLHPVLVLTWDNIAPRMLPTTTTFSYPADIRIELFRDDDLVTVICHSMPNIGMQCRAS
jgi:hypothetical protein